MSKYNQFCISNDMLIGTYFFTVCIYIGGLIHRSSFEHLEELERKACCEIRTMIPEWLYKYIVFMIRGGQQAKLGLFLIIGYTLYTLIVFLASWLFGLVLFRSTEEPGKVYGYGFALYLIIELVIGFVMLVYWFIRAMITSMKKMQDYEVTLNRHLEENPEDEEVPLDRVSKMANHLMYQNQ